MADAIEIAAQVRSGSVTAVEVVEQHLAAIATREPEIHAFNLVMADQARARAHEVDAMVAAGGDPGPLGRRSDRPERQHVHARRADDVLVEDPRRVEAAVRRDGRLASWRLLAPSSSARPTSTSSPWARAPRTRRSARPATRTTPRGCRAAAAVAVPRRLPRASHPSASAATPAGRSANRRRCAGSSASSRPTATSAAMA